MLGIGVLTGTGDGYLSVTGPPPIRFQPVSKTALAELVTPLIAAEGAKSNGVPGATASTNESPTPVINAIVDASEPVVVQAGGDTNLITYGSGLLTPSAGVDASGLVPELLLPYFQRGGEETNAVKVLVPVPFVPPAPMVRPSSKAVYIVPPAAPPTK